MNEIDYNSCIQAAFLINHRLLIRNDFRVRQQLNALFIIRSTKSSIFIYLIYGHGILVPQIRTNLTVNVQINWTNCTFKFDKFMECFSWIRPQNIEESNFPGRISSCRRIVRVHSCLRQHSAGELSANHLLTKPQRHIFF